VKVKLNRKPHIVQDGEDRDKDGSLHVVRDMPEESRQNRNRCVPIAAYLDESLIDRRLHVTKEAHLPPDGVSCLKPPSKAKQIQLDTIQQVYPQPNPPAALSALRLS